MSEIIGDPQNKTPRFREAFERLASEIQAVPESDLPSITVDVQSTVATVLGACHEMRTYREEIVTSLPSFDIKLFDGLESYALALGHAQTAYQTANEPSASLLALVSKVNKTRDILVANVSLLVAIGLLEASVLDDLKGANGHKNIGFDVFALSNILRKNWDKVSSRLTLTLADLDAAENEADQLVTAVGERERAPAVAAQTTRERQAAFYLLTKAYEEVRAALGFLRRKQGDAETIAPSLYLSRGGGKRSSSDAANKVAPVTPAPVVAVPTNAPAVNAPAVVTTPSQTNPVKTAVEAAGPYAQ